MQLNKHWIVRIRFHFFPNLVAILAPPKGYKGLEGVIPPYYNSITSNSNNKDSNFFQWKTTLITPSTPLGLII
jgi:hypothetical protein